MMYFFQNKIVQRSVGVLNIDACVSGTMPDISTSPGSFLNLLMSIQWGSEYQKDVNTILLFFGYSNVKKSNDWSNYTKSGHLGIYRISSLLK